MSASRAKPESPRTTIRTPGHCARSCTTIRATSSTAPRRPVPARPAEFRGQEKVPGEDGERQVAVRPVISVKESPLLLPLQRIVRRVEIEHDLGPRAGGRREESLLQPPPHSRPPVDQLLVTRRPG